jgi:uncharacterized integral membrane protein
MRLVDGRSLIVDKFSQLPAPRSPLRSLSFHPSLQQPMKIIITILVLILLGIVVGSNLLTTMTVVILNQPTVALPIGLWLLLAIGAGILSSILIQLAIFVDRRLLKKQIRQLQSRLQRQDEDFFTYTSPTPEADSSSADKPNTSNPRKNLFNSYRTRFTDRFTPPPSPEPINVNDDDDWDDRPSANRQPDWDDSIPPRAQNLQSPGHSSPVENERIYSEHRSPTIENQPEQNRREVYDADFRLIQPPFREPLASEYDDERAESDFEYNEINDEEEFDLPSSSGKSTAPNRYPPASNLDDEDWGFDFDNEDRPARAN